MKSFLKLCAAVLATGELRGNRTGVKATSSFGGELTYDCQEGFPLTTEKFVPFKQVTAELVGFIRGVTSAADFRQLGTNIWDQNANEEKGWLANPHRKGTDDLGPIYGAQWRRWESIKIVEVDQLNNHAGADKLAAYLKDGYVEVAQMSRPDGVMVYTIRKEIDQLKQLLDSIMRNPFDRAHMVTAWNPGVQNEIALRPCHTFFQCYVRAGGFLDLKMYQRSADLFLGVPFNIASYAAFLHLLAHCTNLKPGKVTLTFGDAHVYETAHAQMKEMLKRRSRKLPKLTINLPSCNIDDVTPASFVLSDYDYAPALKAPMAV